ncbi:class I ribonucleotide reductase maintenance protein YfaE [Catenovulum sediminis]|uniref:Class I ribonucleotide reductase maintenance protein YfaE n=1 Tax=Catenovulum sediminis TaxID=1740262 RepID=A0ABV1RL17_9ALTE|nr:class I ribonucleotide reductase maintenance protein YfaE [Catenovulum sediminis]
MSQPIKCRIDYSDYQSSGKNSLLEYFEAQNLEVHYHCRDGYCGACRTVLCEGQVSYPKEPLAFIRRGEFLPCCSEPSSDLVIEAEKRK